MRPRPLSPELAARVRGKQNPAIMDQALKAVRGNIQGRDIERIFVSRGRLGTLRLKNPVNLTLDIGQFCLRFRGSYPGTEGIKRVQALFILRGVTHPAPARLLAVMSARSDFVPPWLARPHATLVTLGRLGRPECMQVVAGVAAAHGLSGIRMPR
jgi:hypothetical protein